MNSTFVHFDQSGPHHSLPITELASCVSEIDSETLLWVSTEWFITGMLTVPRVKTKLREAAFSSDVQRIWNKVTVNLRCDIFSKVKISLHAIQVHLGLFILMLHCPVATRLQAHRKSDGVSNSKKHFWSLTTKQSFSIFLNNWSRLGLLLKYKTKTFEKKKTQDMAQYSLSGIIKVFRSPEIPHCSEK